MNKKVAKTLSDITNFDYLLTRFNSNSNNINDLDILVKIRHFDPVVDLLTIERGYMCSSHDKALGGRLKGYQKNLVKKGRIKIDLHKGFTWRKQKYLDDKFVWNSKRKVKMDGITVYIPSEEVDAFLILVNIIFEKEYIKLEDYKYLRPKVKRIFKNQEFHKQAQKFGWDNSWNKFMIWYTGKDFEKSSFPVFLPPKLVLYSYWEKLLYEKKIDIISLAYYIFFYTRYLFIGKLPYE